MILLREFPRKKESRKRERGTLLISGSRSAYEWHDVRSGENACLHMVVPTRKCVISKKCTSNVDMKSEQFPGNKNRGKDRLDDRHKDAANEVQLFWVGQ